MEMLKEKKTSGKGTESWNLVSVFYRRPLSFNDSTDVDLGGIYDESWREIKIWSQTKLRRHNKKNKQGK